MNKKRHMLQIRLWFDAASSPRRRVEYTDNLHAHALCPRGVQKTEDSATQSPFSSKVSWSSPVASSTLELNRPPSAFENEPGATNTASLCQYYHHTS